MTLAWEAPAYDGGCAVTGYVIERQDPSTGVWRYALSVLRSSCTASCLEEHQHYRFRVMAENMFGVSEPSESSLMAITREPLPLINYQDFGQCFL